MNSRLTLQPGRSQKPFRILFVCTGNACRSPMAEGIARHYGMGRVEVLSVGVTPATLDRRAVLAMAEMGIDISNHVPKGVGAVAIGEMDLVVTLCDYAQGLFPSGSPTQHRLHWSIKDPYRLWGPDWLVLKTYRSVRDDLTLRIRNLLLDSREKSSATQS
ncbi:MAG: arsenate reductase ArsC [Nitrospirae bacterium]|nr:arsenate reductase ArsC [Nitrospirota bacterium]